MNPPPSSALATEGQMAADRRDLRVLAWCNYAIGAGLITLVARPLVWAARFPRLAPSEHGTVYLFVAASFAMGLVLLAPAMACFHAGRSLQRRREMGFCQVLAGIYCLLIPLGTALGVWTFLVLRRPTVRALFLPAEAGV